MNGLHTRTTLHAFNARHAGTMPEMDAIHRSDTVREAKHAGINMQTDDGLDAARGIICWGLLCAVVAIVLAVLL